MKKVKSILLVDDDETTNFINELMISDMGITDELLQANNGKEAIDLLEERIKLDKMLPDLILLDINMPVMDGFDFLDAYQHLQFHKKPSVIIVMLTTSLNPSDVERAKQAEITDYINKPLTEEKINSILKDHAK